MAKEGKKKKDGPEKKDGSKKKPLPSIFEQSTTEQGNLSAKEEENTNTINEVSETTE